MTKDKYWNRCDVCGRFISHADFDSNRALRQLLTPDTYFSIEAYETLCPRCYEKEKQESQEEFTADTLADILARMLNALKNE